MTAMTGTRRSSLEGSRTVIETIDHNRVFRATRWILTPWGRVLLILVGGGLPVATFVAVGIDIHGKQIELMFASMALGIPLMLLPSLSQRWRSVGANRIPISRIRREVRRERVRVPLFSYISPLGMVAVLAFCGMVFFAMLVASTEIDKLLSFRNEAIERILIEVLLFVIITVVYLIYRRFKRTAETSWRSSRRHRSFCCVRSSTTPAMRVAEGMGVISTPSSNWWRGSYAPMGHSWL
jgi:hypothetical protein